MGKKYDHSRDCADFELLHRKLLPEVFRITKPGGHICWQVGYHVKDGVVTPLDFLIHGIVEAIGGLYLRNRIVWTFGHGLHCRKRFSGRHEVIMWYTKGTDYGFHLDAVRVAQKYPGKTYYKGVKRGEPSSHPSGKNPSNVWDIPSVKAGHVEKTEHPCQYPIALVQRLILALTCEGDLVFDPFAGVGSAGCAAILAERRFIGCEIDAGYYALACDRCKRAARGELSFRPHDKPISEPNPRQRVAVSPFYKS
jgi:adenine-specific DNA-methyltransferase